MRALRSRQDDRLAGIRGFANLGCQRNFTKKVRAELGGGFSRTAMRKNIGPFVAMRTNEIAHIFNYAEHRDIDLFEHGDTAADIEEGDVLRRRNDHCAGERHALCHGQLCIARAGRQVAYQNI